MKQKKQQLGGTFLGFVIGVVVGLVAALAVAVYVTKVPVPFIHKGQSRSAEQNAAEAKKNKDWDPNAPLYGKNPAKSSVVTPATSAASAAPAIAASAAASKPQADKPRADKPAATAATDPLADLAKARQAAAEPFTFFVQVGAFKTQQDADAQRAKLTLTGVETKVTERDQSGSVVYRVRMGPFAKKEDAEKAKAKMEESGVEASLVRVQN
jgi:cell division protein FtsN